MKNVQIKKSNFILLLMLLVSCSCPSTKSKLDRQDVLTLNKNADNTAHKFEIVEKVSYINPNSDSTYYKIHFSSIDDYYYIDNKKDKNIYLLIEGGYNVFDKHFKNMDEAVAYNNVHHKGVTYQKNISIRKKDGTYQPIWSFSEIYTDIYPQVLAPRLLDFTLDVLFQNSEECIVINIKNNNINDGYVQYSFSFAYRGEGIWELLNHEYMNTINSNEYTMPIGYCKDQIELLNKEYRVRNKFIITEEEIQKSYYPICNDEIRAKHS